MRMEVVNISKGRGYEAVGRLERAAVLALEKELEKGIRSTQNGDVYTVEKAWKEINRI